MRLLGCRERAANDESFQAGDKAPESSLRLDGTGTRDKMAAAEAAKAPVRPNANETITRPDSLDRLAPFQARALRAAIVGCFRPGGLTAIRSCHTSIMAHGSQMAAKLDIRIV